MRQHKQLREPNTMPHFVWQILLCSWCQSRQVTTIRQSVGDINPEEAPMRELTNNESSHCRHGRFTCLASACHHPRCRHKEALSTPTPRPVGPVNKICTCCYMGHINFMSLGWACQWNGISSLYCQNRAMENGQVFGGEAERRGA